MVVAAIVVFATYNPSGKSIFHWVVNNDNPGDAWVILGAIVAILVNIALLIAAWKALGKFLSTCRFKKAGSMRTIAHLWNG